ncbi:MAG: MJ0042-type zinc finger domain-containing protein [Roseibacillus sp.]
MTLRIQCPACQRQFTVDEELKSRTVQCGSCEKQFVVDKDAIVPERDRYFPGDIKKPGLKHYGHGFSPADPTPEVDFATATYSESATAADVIPPTPGRTVAGVTGTFILVIYLVILVFGSMGNGVFSDMEIEKRILLSGFVALVGLSLIFCAGFRRHKQVALTGVVLAVMVILFTVILRPKGVPEESQDTGNPTRSPSDRAEVAPVRMSEDEVRKVMTYAPVQRAIDSFGQESVWALWAPEMGQHFRYQIQRYLQRKTGAAARPAFYPRGKGGLLIIEGISIKMPELVELVEHFADVENVYEDLRVLHIGVKGENLVEPSSELESKLNNRTHEAFIVLNKKELEHIDIDRVKDAAQRLSTVEPSRFRSEIARRLVGLLDEDADTEFRSAICKAIMVWSVPEDGSEPAVIRLVEDLIGKSEEVPKSMIEFLIGRRTPGGIPFLKTLWKEDPLDWESEVISMGSQMETVILPCINDENPAAQRSALLILRRVGTGASLPLLRKALETTGKNPDMKLLIERAIEEIENPASVSQPAPEPEVEPLSEPEPAPAPEPEVEPLSEPEPAPAPEPVPTPGNN